MRRKLTGACAGLIAFGSLSGAGEAMTAPVARAATNTQTYDSAATATTSLRVTATATARATTTTGTVPATLTPTHESGTGATTMSSSTSFNTSTAERDATKSDQAQTAEFVRQAVARGRAQLVRRRAPAEAGERRRANMSTRARLFHERRERQETDDRSAATTATPTVTSRASPSSAGTVTGDAASARDVALSRLSAVMVRGDLPPRFLVSIYKTAGRRYHVSWAVLAALNDVETDYGRDLKTSSAGAQGWMQFEPSTWRRYGVTIGGTSGTGDPDNPRDAIFAAARLLHANGASHNLRRAVFAYNHARWYVDEVLLLSSSISSGEHISRSAHSKLRAMLSTARLLDGLPYVWGGGHDRDWTFADGYDCSGFVSAILHSAGFLSEPQTTETLPVQRSVSPGLGRWVTIYDRTDAGVGDDHVIIDIDGQWWESGGGSSTGGGANVHRIRQISPSYLETFNLVLHPRSL